MIQLDFISYIPIILPFLLFLIMLFMGMTLKLEDFKRVALYPKAAIIGLVNQMILLPLIGLAITKIIPLESAFAIGIMLVAASPGGAVSNLISHLSKGDTALSISLTAFSSVITILTIPFIINWSLSHFATTESASIHLPIGKTIVNIFKLTVLPVVIGMILNHYAKNFTKRVNKIIPWISGVIIFIALILIYFKLDEIGNVFDFVKASFFAVLILNAATLAVGFFSAKFMGLNTSQATTISIETGMQNNVLGMAIATSPALLNNSLMAVPAGVYGLLMCTTATIMIFIFRKMNNDQN